MTPQMDYDFLERAGVSAIQKHRLAA